MWFFDCTSSKCCKAFKIYCTDNLIATPFLSQTISLKFTFCKSIRKCRIYFSLRHLFLLSHVCILSKRRQFDDCTCRCLCEVSSGRRPCLFPSHPHNSVVFDMAGRHYKIPFPVRRQANSHPLRKKGIVTAFSFNTKHESDIKDSTYL